VESGQTLIDRILILRYAESRSGGETWVEWIRPIALSFMATKRGCRTFKHHLIAGKENRLTTLSFTTQRT